MSLLKHAQRELDLIGMPDNDADEKNLAMRRNILEIVHTFAEQNHSAFSASYAIGVLERLLRVQPLSALTGSDDEWQEVADEHKKSDTVGKLYQNIRCGHVFKDDNGPYDLEGRVFYEWIQDETTQEYYKKSWLTDESVVSVTFPYVPTTEYVESTYEEKDN